MALIEEFDRSGNWLFRWRSYMPIVLYILAVIVISLRLDTHLDNKSLTWIVICIAISMLGQVIRAITVGYTPRGTSGRNTKEGQVAEVLNTSGIYSTCRHPLYLGNFFMWLGIIVYVGNWWFTLVCCLLFWLYYERIMFAEEYFLRGKFGEDYKTWSDKTPSFWPRLKNWSGAGWDFSIKNVLKREYNGFFAIFISFFFVDVLRNWFEVRSFELDALIQPIWIWALGIAFVVFILLRTLKKKTSVLDVKGREYVGEAG
jgi:protein-S-isoprenylcysteine O-methyltransferase Ste14